MINYTCNFGKLFLAGGIGTGDVLVSFYWGSVARLGYFRRAKDNQKEVDVVVELPIVFLYLLGRAEADGKGGKL